MAMTEPPRESAARRKGWELLAALARRHEAAALGLGILGNSAFLLGSIFFLFGSLERVGIWLFIFGALGMLLGSVGTALVKWKYDGS